MKSAVFNHFPSVVFRDGKKYLWNPIERKPLVNLPEERVRLRFLDYLILETRWPKSRIATEAPLQIEKSKYPLRADLVCFTKEMDPSILIECKAESVALRDDAAEQIARYNTKIQAPHLCITNGHRDFWFHIKDNKAEKLGQSPLTSKNTVGTIRNDLAYWQDRGFAGTTTSQSLRKWLKNMLIRFWSADLSWTTRYLDIRQKLPVLHFDHYYRLIRTGDDEKIALSFLRSPHGGSYMAAILNREQSNRAVLMVNLDRTDAGESANSTFFTPENNTNLDIRKHFPINPADSDLPDPEKWPSMCKDFFNKMA